VVAAYEGGLLQARVAHSTEPLDRIADTLLALLAAPEPPAHPKEPLP
jgi:TetR/AcrR family transcriptional repressor of lmrAB and yxaGH operons